MISPHKEVDTSIDPVQEASNSVAVIGIGNPYRMDDAVGLVVARELRDQITLSHDSSTAHVMECTGGMFELMDLWSGADYVVLVDAVHSGTDPGTIFQIDAVGQPVPSSLFHYSTHGLNLADSVELARLLGKLPHHLKIFGIEGADFGNGTHLSSDVAAAADHTVQSLLHYIHNKEAAETGGNSEKPSHA